jgi:hypothetical protein
MKRSRSPDPGSPVEALACRAGTARRASPHRLQQSTRPTRSTGRPLRGRVRVAQAGHGRPAPERHRTCRGVGRLPGMEARARAARLILKKGHLTTIQISAVSLAQSAACAGGDVGVLSLFWEVMCHRRSRFFHAGCPRS